MQVVLKQMIIQSGFIENLDEDVPEIIYFKTLKLLVQYFLY